MAGFGALYVTPDGSVIATGQGTADHPENRIFLARPNATQWDVVGALPENSSLEGVASDRLGQPTALWANYATDDRGSASLLLTHPLT